MRVTEPKDSRSFALVIRELVNSEAVRTASWENWSFDWVLHLRTASAGTSFNRLCTCSHGCRPHRESGACVVYCSPCRSIMLRQEELAFVKAISTMQHSPANLKELRMALSRCKKKPVVPAGIRSTTSSSEARAPQRLPSLPVGKSKANELARSGDSSEPAIRRPAPDAGISA